MGVRRRLIATLMVAGLLPVYGACSSCKQKDVGPKTDQARPPDHLAPDEAAEGTDHAFGLPLPRRSLVAARFGSSIHVTSSLTPEQLANFVATRVKEGKVTPGTSSTHLESVVPRDDAKRRLTIDVRPLRTGDGSRSEMVVRDTTPPPFDPNLSDEERWKKAGLTPNGQLLDPNHLQ